MEVRVPDTCRLPQVEVGSLFVMVHPTKGNAICLRATYDPESDDDEDQRIVPIFWPAEESSVGVPIYLSALSGNAVLLNGARLEVNPLSANANPSGSLTAIYCRDGRLFFPLNHKGVIAGVADAASGLIHDNPKGNFVAFDEWYLTVEDDWLNREQILPVETEQPTT